MKDPRITTLAENLLGYSVDLQPGEKLMIEAKGLYSLELVKELYALSLERPELELRWIKAHSGLRWNEYADSLATAYRRDRR